MLLGWRCKLMMNRLKFGLSCVKLTWQCWNSKYSQFIACIPSLHIHVWFAYKYTQSKNWTKHRVTIQKENRSEMLLHSITCHLSPSTKMCKDRPTVATDFSDYYKKCRTQIKPCLHAINLFYVCLVTSKHPYIIATHRYKAIPQFTLHTSRNKSRHDCHT